MKTRNGQPWTILAAPFEETLAQSPPADLIAFSPPYVDAREYDDALPFTMADYYRLGDSCFAALKPGGALLINIDAPVRHYRDVGSERGLHPFRLAIDWSDRVGFRFVDRLAYGRLGAPGAYEGRFRNDWEPLFWFQKPGGEGFFDKRVVAEKSKHPPGSGTSRRPDGEVNSRPLSGWAFENNMTHRGTYWHYLAGNGQTGQPDLEASDHPARWPYRLASDIVRVFCPPSGLVVDPFVGAGTTALAATDYDRAFFGGDLSPRWAAEASRLMGEVAPPTLSLDFS